MGYTTYFDGEFTLDKPLTLAQYGYLKAFNESRRMIRNEFVTAGRDDPKRIAVGLPVGKDGQYFVGEGGFMGQDGGEDVLDQNRPPPGQPGLWCQWTPSEDGTKIVHDEGEKFYDYVEWLEYIVAHFLMPWGLTLNGEVKWDGEESSDVGIIRVVDNVVSQHAGRIVYD